jgi:hypothetical protein
LTQLCFHYAENEYIEDEFDYSNDKTIPITTTAMIVYGIYFTSLLIPVYVNYFVFYHYVKKSFKVKKSRNTRLLSDDDVIKITDMKTRREIKSFLCN